MTDKEKIKSIIELFIAWNGETEVIDIANLDSAVDFIIDSLQEEPVSKDLEEAAEDYGIRQGAELKPFAIKFFKAGAKWQKTKSIVDTCYHLKMRLPEYLDYNGTMVEGKDFIDDFCKALEEE